MRELLGEKDNRRLQLVEKIYLEPRVTLNMLSNELFLTPMQIQIDIGFLNSLLQPIEIVVNKEKECTVVMPEHLSIKTVYQKFLEGSQTFNLLEKILFEEFDQYETLAAALHISQATLKRMIQSINKIFAEHDMKIKSRPVRIVGNETNIRAFYMFYITERYPDDTWPFAKSITVFAKDLVAHFGKNFPSEWNYYANRIRMEKYVAIALMRENNNAIESNLFLGEKISEETTDDIARYPNKDNFSYLFKKELKIELYQRLFKQYFERYQIGGTQLVSNATLKPAEVELFQGISDTLDRIAAYFSLEIPSKKELTFKLYNTLSIGMYMTITPYIIFPSRKVFLLFSRPLKETIMARAKKLFQTNIGQIANRNDAYFYEFFYLLVTQWPGFYEKMLEHTPPAQIGLLFNTDVEHALYTKEHLNFIFGKKVDVKLLDVSDITDVEKMSAQVDILLLNFILPEGIIPDVPFVSVADALFGESLLQIQRMVDEQFYKNMKK